ncbi:hypothetical protein HPB52_023199 [Rhipicephalus sanguineus]|uniref:Reverse transcriptase n=1 Tax=Rhipicephalus sanguineus TaxID=34632 RepID=A0A9D4QBZ2_RHISA|nr:hypothetical protein HPB52_023199 [Rhipicephalus sanguineus]
MLDTYVDGRRVRFTNVYAPVTRADTNSFFKEVHASLAEPLPHVILGDFNCVVDSMRDIRGPGRGGSTYHAKELVKILRHLRLTDAWVHLHDDTFGATRSSRTTASRIDRVYIPDLFLPSIVACEVLALSDVLARKTDHAPVLTTVRGAPGPRAGDTRWRLDPALLADDTCVPILQDLIAGTLREAPQVTPEVWDYLKDTWRGLLQQEGRKRKRRITREMNELLRRKRIIESADNLTACTRDYLSTLEIQHGRLLQELTRRPRSTVEGTTEVDLREVNGNGCSKITEARRPDGTITDDQAEIADIFRDHFRSAFQETEPNQPGLPSLVGDLCKNLRRLDEADFTTLCGEATTEELRCAVGSMPPNSAPGTDGLTAAFYATFFETLGDHLLALVNLVLTQRVKPDSFSAGRIVLILKDGAPPCEPESWCPITLLNVDYKIVATILNNRLKLFLPDIVAPHQTCAVPRRSMFANLTMTRDAFEYAATKKIRGAFLSLDQAKAFDRVRHAYLFEMLRQFGLPTDFVDTLKLLYKDLRGSVLVNGSETEGFQYTRGIRQGCPLGPTLFILSLEPLLTNLASDALFRGLPLTGSDELRVLAYADDVSLFVRNPRSLERFRHIFSSYAEASGAQLNEAKSKALLFGAFPADAIGNISIVTTVKVLGVFYTCEGVAAPTWTRVLERAQRFTERASQLDLTLHEKALAAKTSVCALALYISRVAVMPAKAATQLNKIITSFMWNGKPPLLRRSLRQMAVSEGGLGLPHALTLSKILALKTARTLFQASDYLGRGLLLYWSGASNNWLGASRQPVPLAETPSQFYKVASATMRMLSKEAPGCDVDADPPARIAEVLNRAQLSEEEKAQAKNAKRALPTYTQGLPRETHDFLWKKAWNVLPTRQRLHKLGIVPNARCPNCREIETQRHALLDCTAAKPVWRIVARCFGIRPPPYHKRNKSAFARLVNGVHAPRDLEATLTRGSAALASKGDFPRGREHPSRTRGPVTPTWTPGFQRERKRAPRLGVVALARDTEAPGLGPSSPETLTHARRCEDPGSRLPSRSPPSRLLQPTSTQRFLLRLSRLSTRAQRKLRITSSPDTPPRPGERPATPTGMATSGNLPVRENSFLFSAPEGDVSIDNLIDAIETTAAEDSVFVLQHMGGSRFLVCTRNASQATRLMVAEGFRVNNEKVAVEAVGPPTTYVNVYRFPAYIPDEILTNALAQYGKVKGVSFATLASRPHKLNGVRVVKIEMSRPVPNFTTIAGHKVMCEYRGMKRVCARCGEVGHMATACSALFCKRCGIFGHDTDGCAAECKRCGGKHGTRECFRKRSYVAAARGVPPTAGDAPEGDRASAPSNAQATTSGLQVLTPRAPPQVPRQPSPYWDNNQQAAAQTATSASEAQATLEESSDSDGATTVTVDSVTEASSAETSRESWSDARSASEEQEVPQIAEQPDANATPTPLQDSRNFPPLPPASSPPSAPGTAPPGLEKRHRSRSRQRQADANKGTKTARAGSQEMSLRRPQGKVASSDSDAPPQAKTPKLGETPPGGNKEPPDGDVNKA